jgi:hypothetical protein
VDDHAIHNHGVELRGCVNTLAMARWAWPSLVSAGGFGLKNLMHVKLHREPIAEFRDVVGDVRTVSVPHVVKLQRTKCSCGVEGCRKRKRDGVERHDKTKHVLTEVRPKDRPEKFQHPLESIVPGHHRWDLLVRYAAEDAVAALEIAELAQLEVDPAPFPYAATRPAFNQTVENAVVLMERTGVRIDVDYARRQVERAVADEERELVWLHRWYVANAPTHGPHRREEVDAVWSSPKRKAGLFEELGWPRSPVWKKGRVKPGEVKMDATALEWIAKKHRPARQLIGRLLNLGKIRNGKKYAGQFAATGGFVNPVCGAAGDADDRCGAVTGRLGIKGAVPLQQLPTREDADPYCARRAVIA